MSGGLQLTGFPFTTNTSQARSSVTFSYGGGLSITAGLTPVGYIAANATTASLAMWSATTGVGAFTTTQLSADGDMMFDIQYQV